MNKRLFKGLFLGFGTSFVALGALLDVARDNAKMINEALNIKDSITVNIDEEEGQEIDSNYFPSSYKNLDEVTKAGEALAREAEASGLVLLKNDNNALPLTMENPKVSLFGSGSVAINYTPSMSGGSVDVSKYKDLKEALELNKIEVNSDLFQYYKDNSKGRSAKVDGLVKTYTINELSWNDVKSKNESTFNQYNDAAIVVLTRDSGEGFDTSTKNSDGRNGMYIGLSKEETDLLKGLTELKKNNVFKRVIVLLNSALPIELNFLNDDSIDVDSIMWIGNVGGFGLEAVSDALVGKINPSGKLSDTYVKEALSSPAMASWSSTDSGIFAQSYSNSGNYDLNETNKYYGVYVEGIYVGYRYYETRYEDYVLGNPGAGNYDYDSIVAYPFGHGLSYTTFEYSDFKISENNKKDTYTVELNVKNTGNVAGQDVVEVYGQKPYVKGGVEKASVELMGFEKTPSIGAGETVPVTIDVPKESFASYDNITNKTYILDEGDYYLTVGKDAHDAINNILAKKGKSSVGKASFADVAFHQDELDNKTYAKSSETGATITNALDDYDINTYKNRGDNKVTYVSRSNWESTFPKEAVKLSLNDKMVEDLSSHKKIEEDPKYKDVTYNANSGLSLIGLRNVPYDNSLWDDLLNQMTYEEQSLLITNGSFGTSAISSINLKSSKASDGPNFLTSTKTNVAFPSEGIWASSFDMDLLKRIGEYLGEDARINEVDALYGPGINIHRSPFGGRNNEYFSEDPLLTGFAAMNEIQGLQSKGVVAIPKHLAFNEQDSARNGIAIWLNEQAAREIYLLPFKFATAKSLGNAHGCMSAFNRAGADWVGASKAIQETIVREEFGFDGYYVTDMASSNGALYMTFDDGIMAGTNLYLGAGSKTALKEYKSSITFRNKMRESTHRILYVLANYSCIMNGVLPTTKVITITPWWDTLLVVLISLSGVVMFGSLGVVGFLEFKKKRVINNSDN